MEQTGLVVVVEHGDAGGFRIAGGRVIPIPPFEPGLRARLRAAAALMRAAEAAGDEHLAVLANEVVAPALTALDEGVKKPSDPIPKEKEETNVVAEIAEAIVEGGE
jgi:hypothetical protein